MVRRLVGALCALGLFAGQGCAPKEVPYEINLITQACSGPAALEGASHLRFKITGDAMEDVVVVNDVASPSDGLRIPEIPAGGNRRIEVRAYDGDPSGGGTVISLGRSNPFDVPDVVPGKADLPPKVDIFLRRVNAFSQPSLAVSPGSCEKLGTARAGHTATLLGDGRVFIAGGFQLNTNGSRRTLQETEYYNPVTGGFEVAADMGVFNQDGKFSPSTRAFHTATLLPTGQVLLAGGEQVSGQNTVNLGTALVYDAAALEYGGLNMKSARSRHVAVRDSTGRVLIVGGVGLSGTLASAVEWFQIGAERAEFVSIAGDSVTRVGHAAAPVQGGKFVAVAGGSNNVALEENVLFFSFEEDRFVAKSTSVKMKRPRRSLAMSPLGDGARVLIAGGYDGAQEPSDAIATSEVLATGQAFSVADGPALDARGDVCSVQLDDGRVLTVGGRVATGAAPESQASVELFSLKDSGELELTELLPLPGGRHFHTCTKMLDGSVLIVGGAREAGNDATVLQDAFIFMPAPLD